ncbi:hypothetical protein niasHS_011465 [Heterodera schachtii]|uniref:Uncharacterized protein n=1 Tax=Heterodera schachtii TaxID=97005 RepID=A0ABD2IL29_HETSC
MKNRFSFFMLYLAIFWLCYECTSGSRIGKVPKMHGESSSKPGCCCILCLPCTCAEIVACWALDIALKSVSFATAATIDVGYCFGFCCGVVPYYAGSACVNGAKKVQNKKKQGKIEKHLEEITPP